MFNDYNSKRPNTSNYRINNNTKKFQYQPPPQSINYRANLVGNKSPNYINHYRYEQEEQTPYMNQINYRLRRPEIHYEEKRNNEKTMKNLKLKADYFFSGFNSEKDNVEKEKDLNQKSLNTFGNQNQNKLNNTNSYILEKNNKSNLAASQNQIQNDKIVFKENKENNYKILKTDKIPQNFYRNNPLIKTTNYHTDLKIEKDENPNQPVAQKICNIVIKGESKKAKKLKNEKKKKKNNFLKNIEIEGNVAQGSAIPDKKVVNIIKKDDTTTKNVSSISSIPAKNDVNKNKNKDKYYNNKINVKEEKEKEKKMQINEERKPNINIREKYKNEKKEEKKLQKIKKF